MFVSQQTYLKLLFAQWETISKKIAKELIDAWTVLITVKSVQTQQFVNLVSMGIFLRLMEKLVSKNAVSIALPVIKPMWQNVWVVLQVAPWIQLQVHVSMIVLVVTHQAACFVVNPLFWIKVNAINALTLTKIA